MLEEFTKQETEERVRAQPSSLTGENYRGLHTFLHFPVTKDSHQVRLACSHPRTVTRHRSPSGFVLSDPTTADEERPPVNAVRVTSVCFSLQKNHPKGKRTRQARSLPTDNICRMKPSQPKPRCCCRKPKPILLPFTHRRL